MIKFDLELETDFNGSWNRDARGICALIGAWFIVISGAGPDGGDM
jgi:hypothetical protein